MSSKTSFNILLLGSGGRECAIAWKLRQSPLCDELYIAPGNAGTSAYGETVPFAVTDFEAIRALCITNNIDIVIPGGEESLVAGVYDFIKGDEALSHIIVVGPSMAGAQLEGSKAFSKKFMQRHGIPTAAYREFDKESFAEGVEYLNYSAMPIVIKADGLAAGKGVIIAKTREEAIDAFCAMIQDDQFGAAGHTVVVEEFLTGIELSVFILTDGKEYVLLPEAKDYKRIGEGDNGPNTGGMGAVSPVPFANAAFMEKVKHRIINPTVAGLASEGINYNGFIFFGLISVDEEPYVIEYNCRMGDPETEAVMPRLENDLVQLILDMQGGRLAAHEMVHSKKAACTVILVSEGYPGDYAKGKTITGHDTAQGSIIFHSGTKASGNEVLTNGGRVLAVTSLADSLQDAITATYKSVQGISYEGKHYRKDIGWEFK